LVLLALWEVAEELDVEGNVVGLITIFILIRFIIHMVTRTLGLAFKSVLQKTRCDTPMSFNIICASPIQVLNSSAEILQQNRVQNHMCLLLHHSFQGLTSAAGYGS
jgi:hypothetical protein